MPLSWQHGPFSWSHQRDCSSLYCHCVTAFFRVSARWCKQARFITHSANTIYPLVSFIHLTLRRARQFEGSRMLEEGQKEGHGQPSSFSKNGCDRPIPGWLVFSPRYPLVFLICESVCCLFNHIFMKCNNLVWSHESRSGERQVPEPGWEGNGGLPLDVGAAASAGSSKWSDRCALLLGWIRMLCLPVQSGESQKVSKQHGDMSQSALGRFWWRLEAQSQCRMLVFVERMNFSWKKLCGSMLLIFP